MTLIYKFNRSGWGEVGVVPQSSLVGTLLREDSAADVLVGFDGGIFSFFLVLSMWRAIASPVTVAAKSGIGLGTSRLSMEGEGKGWI